MVNEISDNERICGWLSGAGHIVSSHLSQDSLQAGDHSYDVFIFSKALVIGDGCCVAKKLKHASVTGKYILLLKKSDDCEKHSACAFDTKLMWPFDKTDILEAIANREAGENG